MNAISTAMKEAGVRLPPLNKRVWVWLHDHKGGKTSKEIAIAIAARHPDVATVLGNMHKRGMVARSQRASRVYPGGRSTVWEWETLGGQFELAPLIKKNAKPLPPVANVPTVLPNAVDIEALTIREARALYNQLKEYFQ